MATKPKVLELRKRFWQLLGCPTREPPMLRLLAMVAVAWADGVLQDRESTTIREELARSRAKPRIRDHIEKLLAHPPGPYFEHRVLALMRLTHGLLKPGAAEAFAADLSGSAESVDSGAFRVLRRLMDPDDETTQGIGRMRRALAEPTLEDAGAPVAKVMLPRVKGRRLEPALCSRMHLKHDSYVQVRGIELEGRVVACIDPFQFGADLDEDETRRVLVDLAHRPEIERWESLHLAIARLARPPDPELIDQLVAHMGRPTRLVDLAEMCELEDVLALEDRWASWVSGTFHEISIDSRQVRRVVPPGNFSCSREKLAAPRVSLHPVTSVPGLVFRLLHLASADGGASLVLATPEVPAPQAVQAGAGQELVQWLIHFLPLIHDPLSAPVFGYPLSGEVAREAVAAAGSTSWTVELRSGFPEDPTSLRPEVLPPGRALVIPPWVWLRLTWALGIEA